MRILCGFSPHFICIMTRFLTNLAKIYSQSLDFGSTTAAVTYLSFAEFTLMEFCAVVFCGTGLEAFQISSAMFVTRHDLLHVGTVQPAVFADIRAHQNGARHQNKPPWGEIGVFLFLFIFFYYYYFLFLFFIMLFVHFPSPPLLVLFVDIQGDREARAAAIAYALWQEPAVDPDSCKFSLAGTLFPLHFAKLLLFFILPFVHSSCSGVGRPASSK